MLLCVNNTPVVEKLLVQYMNYEEAKTTKSKDLLFDLNHLLNC